MKPQKLLPCILLWSVVSLSNSLVAMDNTETNAREQFTIGVELYREGKFEQAAVAFARAYELRPGYKILWNIGQVENELGHYAAALSAYEQYLSEADNNISEERVHDVSVEIKRLRTLVGAISISTDRAGAVVFIDGKKVGTTPVESPVLVDLGEHDIVLRIGSIEIYREVVRVAGGEVVAVEIEEADTSKTPGGRLVDSPEDYAHKKQENKKRLWTWITLGIGGASAIAGGIVGGVSMGKGNDLKDACKNNSCPEHREEEADTITNMNITADVLYGVAAAGIIAGVVLFFVEPGIGEKSKVTVGPTASESGAGLVVSGRF